jgi:hypothetical protein
MWLCVLCGSKKKITISTFWRTLNFSIGANSAKTGTSRFKLTTKMSHLWCYFQLFNIHYSTFIILHSLFIIRQFDSSTTRQFESSTIRHSSFRRFDNRQSTVKQFDVSTFIISYFRKLTALPQIKSSVLDKYILANYVAMCAMWFKKNHHLTVLANPKFLHWRQFGQNRNIKIQINYKDAASQVLFPVILRS